MNNSPIQIATLILEAAKHEGMNEDIVKDICDNTGLCLRTVCGLKDRIKNSLSTDEEDLVFLEKYTDPGLYEPYDTRNMIDLFNAGLSKIIPIKAYEDAKFLTECHIDAIPDNFAYGQYFVNEYLNSFKILPQIKSIGYRAFKNCINLEEIEFFGKVNEINKEAFEGCSKLKNVYCKSFFTADIGSKCFKSCSNLESLQFSVGKNIPEGAFDGCSGLCFIVSSNIIKNIEPMALKDCRKFKKFVDEEEYRLIHELINRDNSSLLGTTKGDNKNNKCPVIENIGYGAFLNCKKLEMIHITRGIVSENAFFHTGLNTIIIKEPLCEIEKDSFDGSVHIENILISFPEYEFRNIKGYNNIFLPRYKKEKKVGTINIARID